MVGFLGRFIHNYTKKIIDRIIDVKNLLFSGSVVVVVGLISIWVSIFLYVAFYYAYMPSVLHVRPVHLQFKPCEEIKGVCSFPSAHVQLTKKQQLLMIGQPYKMYLYLEMPESPANQKLGMFMVCAHLEDRSGTLVTNACRSAMIHYRSHLLHTLHTLLIFPLLVFGSTEEKQSVVVELFSNFEEDPTHPVTDVYLEVQSRHAEIYSSELRVTAHLTGLRHLMFHWPTFSAGVGVVSILFFLAVLIALSWCHHALRSDFIRGGQKNHSDEKDWQSGDEEEDEDDDEREAGITESGFAGDTDESSVGEVGGASHRRKQQKSATNGDEKDEQLGEEVKEVEVETIK